MVNPREISLRLEHTINVPLGWSDLGFIESNPKQFTHGAVLLKPACLELPSRTALVWKVVVARCDRILPNGRVFEGTGMMGWVNSRAFADRRLLDNLCVEARCRQLRQIISACVQTADIIGILRVYVLVNTALIAAACEVKIENVTPSKCSAQLIAVCDCKLLHGAACQVSPTAAGKLWIVMETSVREIMSPGCHYRILK
jgi:hypothetical protein